MVCKNDLIFDGPVTNNADIMELVASLRKKQKTFKRIVKTPKLSGDVFEIVSKALEKTV